MADAVAGVREVCCGEAASRAPIVGVSAVVSDIVAGAALVSSDIDEGGAVLSREAVAGAALASSDIAEGAALLSRVMGGTGGGWAAAVGALAGVPEGAALGGVPGGAARGA